MKVNKAANTWQSTHSNHLVIESILATSGRGGHWWTKGLSKHVPKFIGLIKRGNGKYPIHGDMEDHGGLNRKPSINWALIFGAWMSVFHSSPKQSQNVAIRPMKKKGVETISSKILKNP